MTTLTHTLLTRVLDSLKHLHTLHGPCTPSPDGEGCPHAAVIRDLENLLFLEQPPILSKEGWEQAIARCSREMDPDPPLDEPYKYLGNFSAVDPAYSRGMSCDRCRVSWTGCWDNFQCPQCGEGELPSSDFREPTFQAVAPFPCEPAQPLSHDPHDLAAALLQAMASGATISTGDTEDVPPTVPVTRRLVITRHGQHWEDIQ